MSHTVPVCSRTVVSYAAAPYIIELLRGVACHWTSAHQGNVNKEIAVSRARNADRIAREGGRASGGNRQARAAVCGAELIGYRGWALSSRAHRSRRVKTAIIAG